MAFWNKKRKENEPYLAEFDASFGKKEPGFQSKKNDMTLSSEELKTDEPLVNFDFNWTVENPFDEMIKYFENGKALHLQGFEETPYHYSGSEELASLTFSKDGYYLELSKGTAIFTVNKTLNETIYFSISMTYESFTSYWEAQIMVTEDVNHDGQVSFDDQNVEYPFASLLENNFDLMKVKAFFNKIVFDEFLTAYFKTSESSYSLKNLGNFTEVEKFELVGVPEYFLPEGYPDFTYDGLAANPFEEIVQKYGGRTALKFDIFKEDFREGTELYLIQNRAVDEFTQVTISPADVIFNVGKAGKTITFDFDERGKLYILDQNFEDEIYIKRCVSEFLKIYFALNQSEFSVENWGNCRR